MKTSISKLRYWRQTVVLAVAHLALGIVSSPAEQVPQLTWATTLPINPESQIAKQQSWDITAVHTHGNLLFCGVNQSLLIFDISGHSDPVWLAEFVSDEVVRSVALQDNILYLVDQSVGMIVVDLSNPMNPRRLSSFEIEGAGDFAYPQAIALLDNRAYLAVINEGLLIVDISDPTRLVLAGQADLGTNVSDVSISNGHGFVILGTRRETLATLDLSAPDAPQLMSELHLPSLLEDYGSPVVYWRLVAGGIIADGEGGWTTPHYFWRIPSLHTPEYVGRFDSSTVVYPQPGATGWHTATVANADVFGIALSAYRFGNGNPKRIGHLNPEVTGNHRGHFQSVAVSGHHAYITETYYDDLNGETSPAQRSRLKVIDVDTPSQPRRVGRLADIAGRLAHSGNHIYAAHDDLLVIDIGDFANPKRTGRYSASLRDVVVSGHYAFVIDNDGMQTVDISDPEEPLFVAGVSGLSGGHTSVIVADHHAYLPNWGGMGIIDLNSPSQPRFVGTYTLQDGDGRVNDLAVAGNYAYVAGHGHNFGFEVVDVSDPSNPRRIGRCSMSGEFNSVGLLGNYAYVAAWWSGLYVIDISDPANPRWVGHHNTRFWAPQVVVHDGLVFVVDQTQGLTIFEPFRSINLGPARLNSQGHMQIELSSSNGQPIRIQRSTNLLDWEDWLELPSSEHPITITDADAERAPQRYYRALEVAP